MTSSFPCRLLAAALLLPAAALAADPTPSPDPRINADTGRAVAAWPHDRPFDHRHMRLELVFPDINAPALTASLTLRVAAIGSPRTNLSLDCRGPQIRSVHSSGRACRFTQDDKSLVITLPSPVEVNEETEVTVAYTLDFSTCKGEGLTFSPAKPDATSITGQHTQIHAQGEAELNSRWFPCHDFPNDRLTTELLVTVADDYQVVSNGRLVSSDSAGNGMTRWHWLQDKPHAAYLVTLAIAKFATVELGGESSARPGLPINVYTPHGTEGNVRVLFAETPRMIACFEQVFDEPYPWDKYAQVIVRDFLAGGMENTSATFLTIGSTRGDPGSKDSLIAHELSHQWFGDLVTCKSWEHIWLNEGWATYAEALWAEYKAAPHGPEAARAAYRAAVIGWFKDQRARNKGVEPAQMPLVSNRYTDPDKVFGRSDDPYAKGAAVLHMLRARLGDDAFFKGTRLYLDRFRFKEVETDDLRRLMEEVSGQSLERFFTQWCLRPGIARLDVATSWNAENAALTVTINQTQHIDYLNPAYAFTLPIYLTFSDGSSGWIYIDTDSRSTTTAVQLANQPVKITVDPNLTVLARIHTEDLSATPKQPDPDSNSDPDIVGTGTEK